MKKVDETGKSVKIEGLPTADWILIDANDVIVHLFRPEVRSFYNPERMWAFGDAPVAAEDETPHRCARRKMGRGPEADLIDRYAKRLTWPFQVSELPDTGGKPVPIGPNTRIVALDEGDKSVRWILPAFSNAGGTMASKPAS